MTPSQPTGTLEDTKLRDDILAFLKKAYFNARTDVVGEQNGLLENSRHALPTLNNMTDNLVAAIQALVEEAIPEKLLDEWNLPEPTFKQRQKWYRIGCNDVLSELRSRFMRAGLVKGEK